MNPDHLATASPLGLLLFVLWIGLSWIAVWKWKNPIYRLPPFIIATAVPVMFGWQNLTVGVITMNIGTAFVLLAYRIDEIWPFKKPYYIQTAVSFDHPISSGYSFEKDFSAAFIIHAETLT